MASHKLRAIISDDLAEVAGAFIAMDTLWTLTLACAETPTYTNKQLIDNWSDNLRRVEAGLQTTRKYLLWMLNENNQTS